MTKVAITADIHFGVPGRLSDILWSVRTMREYCAASNIDTVLILGDLFHDRRSIEIDVLSAVTKFFEETANKYKQKWVVFPGNHDMFLRHSWDINSLTPLRNSLTVIEEIKILQIDNRRFWILPFITYEKPFMKVLKKIEAQYQEGDILLTHVGIRGATLNTCFLLKDWSFITFEYSKFKRVYTGHFHSKQQVGDNVWYPGSPIPFKFDEGDVSHGFYVYDLEEDDHKFINIWKAGHKFFPDEIPPPQFYTITDDVLEQVTSDDINNGIVRVAIQKEYTADEKKQIKDRLIGLGARSVRWMSLIDKIEKQEIIAAAPSKNLFKSWVECDKTGTKDLQTNILYRINDEIIKEGDEKYSVEDSEI
jgi:DNA repair exonuclease SbcCD nuclease subunit